MFQFQRIASRRSSSFCQSSDNLLSKALTFTLAGPPTGPIGLRLESIGDAAPSVQSVTSASPGASAGIKTGDVIERVNGQLTYSAPHTTELIQDAQRRGVAIKLDIVRPHDV